MEKKFTFASPSPGAGWASKKLLDFDPLELSYRELAQLQ
jgi:hypothetical protein